MRGKVCLVGAGPGRADLITVRGAGMLAEADVVIYDYLAGGKLPESVRPGAELIRCDEPAKKGGSPDGLRAGREKINELMVQRALEGRKVVRLKNGDPMIFGRAAEELKALVENDIEFEIVPGVTAGSSASSFSGIPLTDRMFSSSCVFVTGREDPEKKESLIDWSAVSRMGTIVLYMGVEKLGRITSLLMGEGMSGRTPAAVIQEAGSLTGKSAAGLLENIAALAEAEGIRAPAVTIIGGTAAMGEDFNWMKRNKKILFTGLSGERYFEEGSFFHLPLIRIEPLEDYGEFDRLLENIGSFDWIAFASRYGARYFFERLAVLGLDCRVLGGVKIAAVGGSTKRELENHGILADLVPPDESSAGLLESFRAEGVEGKSIFLPRSDISDKGLEKGLSGLGARVSSAFAYRNVMPENLPELDCSGFDEIMFTSPSTVRNFRKKYKKIPAHVKVKCIGAVTLREAEKCGLPGTEG